MRARAPGPAEVEMWLPQLVRPERRLDCLASASLGGPRDAKRDRRLSRRGRDKPFFVIQVS